MSHTESSATFGRPTILPPEEDPSPSLEQPAPERPRFQPIAELGSGAVGQVIAARDLDIGRRVAIKRLLPQRRSQGNFLRFLQEVRTAGQLEHPNIVPIHDVGREEDGNYYIVMKYIDGETLEAILTRLKADDPETHKVWTFERRIEVFMQVLNAVRFAHDHGIIHRDIKPANIMIGQHGEVQLLDWGIAKRKSPSEVSSFADTWIGESSASGSKTETKEGAIVGTPLYMAPEQARGEPADERSETYTLCLLLYELLSLENPRNRYERLDEMLEAIQKQPIPAIIDVPYRSIQGAIPVELCWFLHDGLSIERSARYPDVSTMIDILHRRNNGEIRIRCGGTLKKALAMRLSRLIDRRPMLSSAIFFLPLIGALACLLMLIGSFGALLASFGIALWV